MKFLITFPDNTTATLFTHSVQEAARIIRANGKQVEGSKIQRDPDEFGTAHFQFGNGVVEKRRGHM